MGTNEKNMRTVSILIVSLMLASCVEDLDATVQQPNPGEAASGTLPVMHIETEGRQPVTSKTEYLNAWYWLDPSGKKGVEPLGSETARLPMQIRGRGHSSWKSAKKPYKLKLAERTPVAGLPANKHFALLKPSEATVAGLLLGRIMGMSWTPGFRPVEVVLNGDYIGLYFLTETIRIDKDRVNIYRQKDQETNTSLVSGGWLVEVDNYRDECQITIPESSRWNLTLRYHSPEVLSGIQLEWLTDEFKSINAAIYSPDKTSTEWEEYVDVESMARFFILQEVMDNPDGFHGSFYLHKDLKEDARWIAGPVWDMVCYNRAKTDYTFRMKAHYGFTPHWIGEIIQYGSFCAAVRSVWNEVYPDRLAEIYGRIDDIVLPLAAAWQSDCERWDGDPTQTAQARATAIKTALRRNIDWFNGHLPVSPYVSAVEKPVVGDRADGPATVYDLRGIRVGKYGSEAEAISNLGRGVYIINGKKIRVD